MGGNIVFTGSGRFEVLITGGAGFIGTNLAHSLARQGHSVVIYDSLARPGVERNLAWLQGQHGAQIRFVFGDIRNTAMLAESLHGIQCVFHLAGQVAVTTSLTDPMLDFEVNARGTLNLLEVLRGMAAPPVLIFTSTSKVLGGIEELAFEEGATRYVPKDQNFDERGFDEASPIRFRSPFGCSKGAAEQYVLDYARYFGIRAVVFRLSSVFGPFQCGSEDQGWVAHFLIQTLLKRGITFYGDGKQVRDPLYIDDLLEAFQAARDNLDQVAGQVFNIGGGPLNSTSLIELVDLIGEIHGSPLHVTYKSWRQLDFRYYVSDASRFAALTGWGPSVRLREGVVKFYQWLRQNPQHLAVAALSANAAFSVGNQEVA